MTRPIIENAPRNVHSTTGGEYPEVSVMYNRSGYTLLLVMLILSIAGTLFTITITDLQKTASTAKREVYMRQARMLALSGLVRTEFFLNGGDSHTMLWETPGYDEPVVDFGTIHLEVEQFGVFSRVVSTGKRFTSSFTLSGLYGRNIPQPLAPSLTLTGHVGGLILHKGSEVEGDIVLHHGYVYARKKGQPLPDYTRRLTLRESAPLPFDTLLFPALFEKYASRLAAAVQTGPAYAGTLILDGTNDSLLRKKPLVVSGDCRIRTSRCDTAEIAVSGICYIETGAALQSTICLASKIVVENGVSDASLFYTTGTTTVAGGRHNSQFISRDSLIIKNGPVFGKMSVFAGYREERKKDSLKIYTGGIYGNDNATIRGTLICCADPRINRGMLSPSIVIGRKSTVTGSVITDGDCYLYECSIIGRVWARAIVARDEEGSYTDYLIASTIKTASSDPPFPLIGEMPVRLAFEPGR